MWRRNKYALLVLPALLLTITLFFGGLADGLLKSFGYFPAIGQETLHLSFYQQALTERAFQDSLFLTVRVALLSTIFATILGVVLALVLYTFQLRSKRPWLFRLLQLPLTIPHLAAGYFMVLVLSQSGLIARLAHAVGWIDAPAKFPVMVNDAFGWGMVITYTWKEAPFVSLLLYPVLARIGNGWYDTARIYGARPWNYMGIVLLPAIRPALVTASLIVFVYTLTAFEVPYLLGVTYPATLPVYAYQLYTSGNFEDRSQALAIFWLLSVVTLFFGLIAYRLYRKSYDRGWE